MWKLWFSIYSLSDLQIQATWTWQVIVREGGPQGWNYKLSTLNENHVTNGLSASIWKSEWWEFGSFPLNQPQVSHFSWSPFGYGHKACDIHVWTACCWNYERLSKEKIIFIQSTHIHIMFRKHTTIESSLLMILLDLDDHSSVKKVHFKHDLSWHHSRA